jgi:2-desacetyl-2-hydroxyethyl bacteriochlorophyllide A dehydrogenase
VEVIAEPLPQAEPGQVLVQTEVSAISAGTEMLFYRGQAPVDIAVDAALGALGQGLPSYPLRYGYACVGRVVETGRESAHDWLGRRVFAFHPHTSHFWARAGELLPVPEAISSAQAAFLPNMETAVNLVMDGQPALGERVAVVGQGVVGLLTLSILRLFPLHWLAAVDPLPQRRDLARTLGADYAIDPAVGLATEQLPADWQPADLTYELSGNPAAMNTALALTGFGGRVVIGSWYGQKQAPINLGGTFHRSRIRLLASQVSTIDPQWSGRWDKTRRFVWAWRMLERLPVEQLISHHFAVEDAAVAYHLIDSQPQAVVQVLLNYTS